MIYQMELPAVEGFGAYQQLLVLLCVLGTVPQTWMQALLRDSLLDVNFSCRLPEGFSYLQSNITEAPSPCLRYQMLENISRNASNTAVLVPCERWDYDSDRTRISLVQQFDLVCHNAWLRGCLRYSFEACLLVGMLIFGQISDSHGRRMVLFTSSMLFFSFCTLASLAPGVVWYAITTSVAALGAGGFRVASMVLYVESLAAEWRCTFTLTYPLGVAVGVFTWTALQFLTQSWMFLQLATGLCMVIVLPLYIVIQESYSWYIVRGKRRLALKTLMTVLKINGTVADRGVFDDEDDNAQEVKPTCCSMSQLCRSSSLRLRFLLLLLIGAAIAFSSATLEVSLLLWVDVPSFWLRPLVHCVLLAAVFPALICLRLCQRRWTLVILLLIVGIAQIAGPYLPHRATILPLLLVAVMLVVIRCAFMVAAVSLLENITTPVRAFSLGTWLAVVEASLAVVPHIFVHAAPTHTRISILVVGTVCIVAAILSILLPETKDSHLPDWTCQEQASFAKRSTENIPLSSEGDDQQSPCLNTDL